MCFLVGVVADSESVSGRTKDVNWVKSLEFTLYGDVGRAMVPFSPRTLAVRRNDEVVKAVILTSVSPVRKALEIITTKEMNGSVPLYSRCWDTLRAGTNEGYFDFQRIVLFAHVDSGYKSVSAMYYPRI
jgi:hypothetical protein